MSTPWRVAGVAAGFAACGWATARGYELGILSEWLLGLPFGAVLAVLVARRTAGLLAVLGMTALFPPAVALAMDLYTRNPTSTGAVLALGAAGAFGGLGVGLCCAIVCGKLLQPLVLAAAAATGCVAAEGFFGPLQSGGATAMSFVLWQAAVGVYIYIAAQAGPGSVTATP